jgi:hypothetical protein
MKRIELIFGFRKGFANGRNVLAKSNQILSANPVNGFSEGFSTMGLIESTAPGILAFQV